MGRKKLHIIDPDAILGRLAASEASRAAAIDAELRALGRVRKPRRDLRWRLDYQDLAAAQDDIEEGWVPYDLAVLSGTAKLTESQKVLYRGAVRALAAAGLVEVSPATRPTWLRLTATGRERVEAKGTNNTCTPLGQPAGRARVEAAP